MNPYQKALLWIGGAGVVGAIVLAALGNAQSDALFGDPALAQTLGAWADIFGLVGVTAAVGTLVVSAVLWRPKKVQDGDR